MLGYYSKEPKSYFCKECPPGYKCPDKTDLTQCLPGTFSTGKKTECSICSPGFYCPYIKWVIIHSSLYLMSICFSQDVQLNCPIGSYSSEGASFCTPCEKGSKCPKNNVKGWSLLANQEDL